MYRSKSKGFTLIELMITVAIISILAAIAYPSYVNKVQQSRRADARSALSGLSQALERYYTEVNSYASATLGSSGVYPTTSPNGYYTLTINPQTSTTYTINAAPGGTQTSDKCGTFSLTDAGVKSVNGSLTVSQCW